MIRGKLACTLAAICTSASAGVAQSQPQSQPAPPATTEPVPANTLKARPYFRSGTMPDSLPEVLEIERLGRSGRVVAEGIVTPAGTLTDITIQTSSGLPKLDAAIVAALGTWRLSSPLDRTGAKVATRAKFPFAIGRGPKLLFGPAFAWPPGAREAFHNGKVSVTFAIGTGGVPADMKVSRSSGSSLLDGSLMAAVAASRYTVPLALDGTPTPYAAQMTWEFSQAEGGAGSYIEGLRKYSCKAFVGEHDWRAAALPAAQLNDTEFYNFMTGLALLSPESFGWKNGPVQNAGSRHHQAWQNALERCRTNPGSTFLAEYKQG